MSDYADAFHDEMQSLTSFVVGRQTLAETLDHVSHLACRVIPGADVAGLTLLRQGSPTTSIYTDERSPEIDRAQYESGSGPCLEALRLGQIVRMESTESEDRWPEFREQAKRYGIHSTLSLPLIVDDESVGALNLYATQEHAFPESAEAPAAALAGAAAVALANARAYWEARDVADHLHEAMKSRAVIEQAKGMLMAAQGCTADEAFDLLVKASQRSNRKLRTISEELVTKAMQGRPPAAAGPS